MAALALAWAAVVVGGIFLLARYKSTPGEPARALGAWPAESRLARDPGRPTLLMLTHPRCPCTRASLSELAKLLPRLGSRVTAHIVLIKPAGVGDDFVHSDLVDRARSLPGVHVTVDEGGAEARRFGAFTSGQVLLYGVGGELLFAGGITASRGHEGENPGTERIVELVAGKDAPRSAPVFGCPLNDPAPSGGI